MVCDLHQVIQWTMPPFFLTPPHDSRNQILWYERNNTINLFGIQSLYNILCDRTPNSKSHLPAISLIGSLIVHVIILEEQLLLCCRPVNSTGNSLCFTSLERYLVIALGSTLDIKVICKFIDRQICKSRMKSIPVKAS